MSNLQVEANQSTNNIPITLTPKQQPTLLLTPDKVWGTKDYENLENKPSLNGRELTKGMTLADFNLHPDKVEKNEEDIININEYLKELTPKNTAEGEFNLHIKDALELPIFEMSIEGNSYQQQTTGKQLYNVYDTVTVSEKATVDSDGWITISETNTTQPVIYHNYYTNNLNLVGGKEYAIILEVKEVGGTGRIILTSNHTYEDGTRVAGQFEDSIYLGFSSLASNSKKVFLKTTIEDPTQVMNGLRTYLEFQNGNSGSITFRISVLEDTNVTPETFIYEPYSGEAPGPNPNYSQEVEVIEAYNLFNKDIFVQGTWDNPSIKNRIVGFLTPVKAGESYVASLFDPAFQFSIGNVNTNTQTENSKLQEDSNWRTSTYTYNITKDGFLFVQIAKSDNSEITLKDINNNILQVSKGLKPKSFAPYGCIRATIVNKNLFTLREGTLIRSNGVVTTFNKSEYKIDGTTTNATNLLGGNVLIGIFPAGTYKYSSSLISGNFEKVEGGSFATYLRNSNNSGTSSGIITQYGNTFNHQRTFTLTEETPLYLQLYTNAENTGCVFNDCIIKAQIEREDSFTDYVEHKENYIDINLQGNFIGKMGNIKDTLRVKNGRNILLTKRINKIILDSSDGWYKSSIASIDRYGIPLSTLNIANFEGMQMLCNYFKYTTNQIVMKGTFKIINNHLYMDFSEYGTSTLDDFKTWLSKNPVIIYYILAEPYEVNLGEAIMPRTFKNINNVQAMTNMNPSNINLIYALDLKKYYDNKIAELSNQLL